MAGKSKRFLLMITVKIIIITSLVSMPSEVFARQAGSIVIDPGHGGIDFGCTIGNLREKDINLGISKEVKRELEKKGYNVILTRDSDKALYKSCDTGDTIQRRELNARVGIINNSGANLFASIHVNSYKREPDINGSIVYFFSRECLQSRSLARSVQRSLNSLDLDGGKRMSHNSRPEDYYILKKTAKPGILVEAGFLSNPRERKLLQRKEYIQNIARSISLGIQRYMERSNSVTNLKP